VWVSPLCGFLGGGASFVTSRGASLTRCLHEAIEVGAAMRLVSCYAARLSEREGGILSDVRSTGPIYSTGGLTVGAAAGVGVAAMRLFGRGRELCDLTRRIADALLA